MAQSNRGFAPGKMNQDKDERLVPSGEYREAQNIQVSSSDYSDAGSAQSVLGNTLMSAGLVPSGSVCVGSIAYEKKDKIYYFIAGPKYDPKVDFFNEGVWKDYIIEYDIKTETFKYVFVDIYRAHYTTIIDSVDRNQYINSSSISSASNARREMLVNGYDTNGNHIIVSDDSEVTEVISVNSGNGPYVNIYSTSVDYTTTVVPAGTLLQCAANKRVLNFNSGLLRDDAYNIITGINIIDDMIFWTDNRTEPKKINIKRCIAGTGGDTELPAGVLVLFDGDNADWHTRLCVTPDKNNPLRVKRRKNGTQAFYSEEENVTVIRKGPTTPPRLVMSQFEDGRDGDTFSIIETSIVGTPTGSPPYNNSLNNLLTNGDIIPKDVGEEIKIYTDNPVHWKVGDMILFNQEQEVNSPEGFNEHDVRATVLTVPSVSMPSTGEYSLMIQSIDRNAIDAEEKAWNVRLEQKPPMFEFKFARFAYRYKYEDGEYSTYSPFSEPAFLPGEYDYLPKKGFNLGMTNRLRQLKITNYVTEDSERPQDIVEIDLLFKDETSPNIYVIETIKMTDGWNEKGEKLWPDILNGPNTGAVDAKSRGEYEVTSELISSTLPSNQLLRSWDNVPRKALAQSISANRLVYGNYLQNFNLTDDKGCEVLGGKEIKPIINVSLKSFDAPLNAPDGTAKDPLNGEDTEEGFPKPGKTVRSLRTYQVGVVYGDEYGRETPVLAGEGGSGSIKIDIKNSSTLNQLRLDIATPNPDWAYYYKFFIKETSNEYYNMAMDRFYDAEDGNIWLSFASADRNKVDLETFIILKKQQDNQKAVTDNARYKILAIENSAPDFIKTNIKVIGQLQDNSDKDHIGTSGNGFPMPDFDQFWCASGINGYDEMFGASSGGGGGDARLINAVNKGELYARARTQSIKSKWYQISHYVESGGYLKFKSDKAFGEDMAFTSANTDYASRISGLRVELANFAVENKKEFEGRFFVKIYKDLVLIQNLLRSQDIDYRVRMASPIGYFNMPWVRAGNIQGGNTMPDGHPGKEYASWERCGINNEGDFADFLPGSSHNPSLGSGLQGGSSDDNELFFRTATGNWTTGASVGTCTPQTAVRKWCEKSTGRFFFDAKWVRASRDANMTTCAGWESCRGDGHSCNEAYDGFLGPTRGEGIHDEAGPQMSMDIGYISPGDYTYGNDGADEAFINLLMTPGTTFRFREDIDGIVYKVTNSEGTIGANSNFWNDRYGLHHNWTHVTAGENGNNVWRWRIDVEVEGLPGIGIGKGPSGYHPLGGNPVTSVDGRAEMGYWGGRHGSEHWNSNNSWGDDELDDGTHGGADLRSPLPPGYSDSVTLNGHSATYTDPVNGHSVTGLEQALRWRNHASVFHHIEIVEPMEDEDNDFISDNPAIWETEPKEDADLDIYYEASPALPTRINFKTNEMFAPYGSLVVDGYGGNGSLIPAGITLIDWSDNQITLSSPISPSDTTGSRIGFMRPDGMVTYVILNERTDPLSPVDISLGDAGTLNYGASSNKFTVRHNPVCPNPNNHYSDAPHNQPVDLSWYNAWAFGNGVESDRIRDDFNQSTLANGVKASSTIAVQYKEERRSTGLIHSGIYNSTSGLNELNQFIQAEKITKDMNPEYGSIQKLHTRDGDIVVMHEDKIMKVLADKDALFNADGKSNVALSSNFLGSDEAFATKYGISTNPESFATDLHGRIYFTDRTRSAVLRLSGDGITNISDYGMKYWFNRYFNPYTNYIIGSYDARKDLYNVTVDGLVPPIIPDGLDEDAGYNNGCGCLNVGSQKTNVGSGNGDTYRGKDHDEEGEEVEVELPPNLKPFTKTLSFSEVSKGWVSFKSFIPENAVSINNEYYTFKDGMMYKHHSNITRNFFYGRQYDSYIDLLFNDQPEVVKNFATLSYEGSQARITKHLTPSGYSDNQYYNLKDKKGWYIDESTTDLQSSGQLEFKDKEGKYFTHMKGNSTTLENLDESEFSVQGIGILDKTDWVDLPDNQARELFCLNIQPQPTCGAIYGCVDRTASNFNPIATIDDGSCLYDVYGCTDDTPGLNPDVNGSGGYLSFNYNPDATIEDGSCTYCSKLGCTDPLATNYDAAYDCEDGSCIFGCASDPYTDVDSASILQGESAGTTNNCSASGVNDGIVQIQVAFHADVWNVAGSTFDVNADGTGNVKLYWCPSAPFPGFGQFPAAPILYFDLALDGVNFANTIPEVITNDTYQSSTQVPGGGLSLTTLDTQFTIKQEGCQPGYYRWEVTDPNGCVAEYDTQVTMPAVPVVGFGGCGFDGTVAYDFSLSGSNTTPGWEDAATHGNPASYNRFGTSPFDQHVSLQNAMSWYALTDINPLDFPEAFVGYGKDATGTPYSSYGKFRVLPGELYAAAHTLNSFGQATTQQVNNSDPADDRYVEYVKTPGSTNRSWQGVKHWAFFIMAGKQYSEAFIEAVGTMINDPDFSGNLIDLTGNNPLGTGINWNDNFQTISNTYTSSGFYSSTYHSSGSAKFKSIDTAGGFLPQTAITLGETWSEVLQNLNRMFYSQTNYYSFGANTVTAGFWTNASVDNGSSYWTDLNAYGADWGWHQCTVGYRSDPGVGTTNMDIYFNTAGSNPPVSILPNSGENSLAYDSTWPWAIRLYMYNHWIVYGAGKIGSGTYYSPLHTLMINCDE